MNEPERLAERFEEHRTHLRTVAYRMLGSVSEADGAVQESWLHVSRADTSSVRDLRAWLTTVVARVCLDMLRSRASRREDPFGEDLRDSPAERAGLDPEREALLADPMGPALLVVLETLSPPERIAFVLHDLFGVPFDEIGPIVGRTPQAARKLASRARRRVHGASASGEIDRRRQREIVEAFLAASRSGDLEALLAVLDPDVELRADAAAVQMGAAAEVRGARDVAATFSGRALAARAALVDGAAGLVWSVGGRPKVVFAFTVAHGRVTGIEMVADDDRLARLEVAELGEG